MSAIGWHGLNMERYLASIIPISSKLPNTGSMIHHMSNVHVKKKVLSYKVRIKNIIFKNLKKYKHPSKVNRITKQIKYDLYKPFQNIYLTKNKSLSLLKFLEYLLCGYIQQNKYLNIFKFFKEL